MGMKKEIESVLHAHAEWRERFNDILNGRAPFDLEKISATNQCVFGHWLDNEGHRMLPTQVRDEICLVHKEFHQIAADIIQKIKEKRYVEAKNDISLEGALNQKSMQLRSLLVKLSFSEPARANSALEQDLEAPTESGAAETLPPPAEEIHLPDTPN